MRSLLPSALLLLVSATSARAMDMDGSAPMNPDPMAGMNNMGTATPGQMLGYLHFAPLGDILWFAGWVPTRTGPMVGACVGLFLLAVFDRWLAAARAVAERSWARACVQPSPHIGAPADDDAGRAWRMPTA
jgi:copper transporter 1